MRILMVSGFLGAGKTTFIRTMAEVTGRDFVVLENEYGQTDIDSQLLQNETDMQVYELTQGCVCCTMKQDFANSVLTIANTLDPEVLVVEPTGVAKLSSLMENVGRIEYERIGLLAPVAIVDGLAFERQMVRADEIYLDQIRHASVIVVSKTAHAGADERAALEERLRALNPAAEIVTDAVAERDAAWFEALLARRADGSACDEAAGEGHGHDHGPGMETLTLHDASLDSPDELVALLDAVSFGVFGDVARAKGYLPCGEGWLRFDVVEGLWGITGFADAAPEKSEVVFIGVALQRGWLREAFVPAYRRALSRPERLSA